MTTVGDCTGAHQDKEARDLVALVEQHKAEVQRDKDSGVEACLVGKKKPEPCVILSYEASFSARVVNQ